MATPLDSAAEVYRMAMRDAVRRHALLFLSEAILLVIVGLLAMLYPLLWPVGIATPIGWMLLVSAALQAVVVFSVRQMPHFAFQLLPVAISVVIALMLIGDAQQSRETVIALIITFLVVQGVSRIAFGLGIRPLSGWNWVMGSGVLGVLLALVLLGSLPSPATWLVGLLVGLEFVAEGAAIGFLAWQVRMGEKS